MGSIFQGFQIPYGDSIGYTFVSFKRKFIALHPTFLPSRIRNVTFLGPDTDKHWTFGESWTFLSLWTPECDFFIHFTLIKMLIPYELNSYAFHIDSSYCWLLLYNNSFEQNWCSRKPLSTFNLLLWRWEWELQGYFSRSRRGHDCIGSCKSNYLCNQCLSPLMLWV